MMMLYAFMSSAFAVETEPVAIRPELDAWVAHQETSPFPSNADGVMGGQSGHLLGRQILGADLKAHHVGARFGVGLTEHLLHGPTWEIPGSIDERYRDTQGHTSVHLRSMSVTAALPVAEIETGLVTSHWGLGMLANDGAHDPYFGLPEFGDRVIRARLTTQPIQGGPWYLSGAFDRVIQDEHVVDVRRQWAQQAILSALWKSDKQTAGLYGVARRQDELDTGRYTRTGVLDGFFDVQRSWSEDWSLRIAAEFATISGKTNRTTSYTSPSRLRIRSAGGTGLSMLSWRWMGAGASFGYASGDGDPSDDELNEFRFDRNHNVGMILFDEVGGAIEAAAHVDLVDPDHGGSPPDGVETIVTEGAFRRATFVQPRLEFDPAGWLHIRSGFVLAWSTAPIAHPFYTVRNGGVPLNQMGTKTSGYGLGTEWDVAVRISPLRTRMEKTIGFAPSFSVQTGRAWLHENLGGGIVNKTIFLLRVN